MLQKQMSAVQTQTSVPSAAQTSLRGDYKYILQNIKINKQEIGIVYFCCFLQDHLCSSFPLLLSSLPRLHPSSTLMVFLFSFLPGSSISNVLLLLLIPSDMVSLASKTHLNLCSVPLTNRFLIHPG